MIPEHRVNKKTHLFHSLFCIVHSIMDILKPQNFSRGLHMRALQHLQSTENNVKQFISKSVKEGKMFLSLVQLHIEKWICFFEMHPNIMTS